jgi:mannose-6-phosphate isomerase-like protein (cupin superfamily)
MTTPFDTNQPTATALQFDLNERAFSSSRSVCGNKAILIEEQRIFGGKDQPQVAVAYAKLALLEIVDSPVHKHCETTETYHILEGSGTMILGDKVITVQAGSFIYIPPGVAHGLCSDNRTPVRVLMTFSPGMAPITSPLWRDEEILHNSTREFAAPTA